MTFLMAMIVLVATVSVAGVLIDNALRFKSALDASGRLDRIGRRAGIVVTRPARVMPMRQSVLSEPARPYWRAAA